eukprot:4441255-Pyramimonas_sp.AAC.1
MTDLRTWKVKLATALEDGMAPLTFVLWLIEAMFTHPGRLGKFCRCFLRRAHSPQQQGQRFRDALPLAAPPLANAGAWKLTCQKPTAATVDRLEPESTRTSAATATAEMWVFAQVMLTNYQYAGSCGEEAWGHHSHYSSAQVRAIAVMREAV